MLVRHLRRKDSMLLCRMAGCCRYFVSLSELRMSGTRRRPWKNLGSPLLRRMRSSLEFWRRPGSGVRPRRRGPRETLRRLWRKPLERRPSDWELLEVGKRPFHSSRHARFQHAKRSPPIADCYFGNSRLQPSVDACFGRCRPAVMPCVCLPLFFQLGCTSWLLQCYTECHFWVTNFGQRRECAPHFTNLLESASIFR